MSLSQAEFGVLIFFMLLIYSETKNMRAIESNGKLISLNNFMENKDHTGQWQGAAEYLAGLVVIPEETVKWHHRWIDLASTKLDEKTKATGFSYWCDCCYNCLLPARKEPASRAADLGYVLDYSTLGQFPERQSLD